MEKLRLALVSCFGLCLPAAVILPGCHAPGSQRSTELIRYGGMHETIGQKQHEGRVSLVAVLDRPHFYGVGALEGLRGEITIVDSEAVVTGVGPDGGLQSLSPEGFEATLLVGQSIGRWTSVTLTDAVSHERFDETVASAATGVGLDDVTPFMFVMEGEFADVRLHVINGACPVRARIKKLELAPDERPFELEKGRVTGTLVGLFAADAVGELTHPATSVHAHLVYVDPQTGERVTGHVEQVGLAPGALLMLPEPGEPGAVAKGR